jgi:hypothetical protein
MDTAERKALWLRLRAYQFDDIVPPQLRDRVLELFGGADASVSAFANKLCRKLGWESPFALEAIAEYKRFVYLGVTSPFHVTPSRVIDQVWHEHVLFTHGYQTFCDEVLGKRFDHYPELIPTENQTEVFQAQYLSTLDLYEREFGMAPPPEVWSVPKFKRPKAKKSTTRKAGDATSDTSGGGGETPLCQMFGDSSSGGSGPGAFAGFAGGTSGGGGASDAWDSVASDAADAGGAGDSGGSGCSGSSCSSGCGGGD